MQNFLSCDWGTSSFRLRLINAENLIPLAEISGKQGISIMYNEWITSALPEEDRISFYQRYLFDQLSALEKKSGCSLKQEPIIISGMASASIGMKEIPYKALPFSIGEANFNVWPIAASEKFPHSSMIISGVKTSRDVMRGEETMLAGCDISTGAEEQLYIFPGTHSKHITVQHGQALDIKTYMTGEFFELLSAKSILSASVKKEENAEPYTEYFIAGVMEGASENLMNTAFHVRTNSLFNTFTPSQNYHFLSGALIGSELGKLPHSPAAITLVCNESIRIQYHLALQRLLPGREIKYVNADEALVRGQYRIALKRL
ncbi:MAG: 2-dehydro-3-deoxygalactonokinase [Flavitalea sp.]